jgi:Bifunctional DNA primase/polymerase, N-terminal/CHC2 zinc finger
VGPQPSAEAALSFPLPFLPHSDASDATCALSTNTRIASASPQRLGPMQGTTQTEAIYYSRIGWRVVPVPEAMKHPVLRQWQKLHLTTDQIEAIYAYPDQNISLLTGYDFDVLDIDPPDGEKNLRAYLNGPYTHIGPEVITGRGGRHYFFRSTGYGNKAHLLGNIDYRGIGGQVIAPPSISEHGPYQWANPFGPDILVPEAPKWLLLLLKHSEKQAPTNGESIRSRTGDRPPIAEVAARLGLIGKRMSRNRYKTRCPFHDNKGEPSLEVNTATNTFKCWSSRCNAWGDSIDLAQNKTAQR